MVDVIVDSVAIYDIRVMVVVLGVVCLGCQYCYGYCDCLMGLLSPLVRCIVATAVVVVGVAAMVDFVGVASVGIVGIVCIASIGVILVGCWHCCHCGYGSSCWYMARWLHYVQC